MKIIKLSNSIRLLTKEQVHMVYNPDCRPGRLASIIDEYILDEYGRIKSNVGMVAAAAAANHPNCPPETLDKILQQKSWRGLVSQAAAQNPNLPQETIIAILEGDPRYPCSNFIAKFVSMNPAAPEAHVGIWRRNHERKRFDHELELEQSKNGNPPNRNATSRIKITRISQLDERGLEIYDQMRTSLFTPESIRSMINWYLHDPSNRDCYEVHAAIRNSQCPTDLLATVVDKGLENSAMFYAVRNPNCPPETLSKVMEKLPRVVGFAARSNPNAPEESVALFDRNVQRRVFDEELQREQKRRKR